jgi:hypothetical protein
MRASAEIFPLPCLTIAFHDLSPLLADEDCIVVGLPDGINEERVGEVEAR